MSETPDDRRRRNRKAANVRWSQTSERYAATAPARRGAEDRFERLVDPERKLSPEVRRAMAANARAAFYADLSAKGVAARKRKAA